MTSEHQTRANRRNAQLSTGPQTPEGRARSSMNRLSHGGYSSRCDALTASLLREDPAEIQALVEDVMEELRPQSTLETAAARAVAERLLMQVRAGRIIAPLLESAELPSAEGESSYAADFGERLLAAIDAVERGNDDETNWPQIVNDVRVTASPPPTFRLGRTWPDGEDRGPVTNSEWRTKFVELVDVVFGDLATARDSAENHINKYRPAAEAEERDLTGSEAKRILEQFERLSRLHERVDRGVSRALATYRTLCETEEDGEPPPWL